MSFIVAIDGPSGTGKGTVTSALAEKFNLLYLDTGAMYRCVTLYFLENNVDTQNNEAVKKALKEIKIDFKKEKDINKVFLNGKDVTKEIRMPNVNEHVSSVSHISEVRYEMAELQRKVGSMQDSILEGRDIGTNVFPNADVKIYLDASVDVRVQRRVKQNKEKGIEMTEEQVRKSIMERDESDRNAKIAPLKQAEDAIYIDTSNLTIKGEIAKIAKIIKKQKKYYNRIENGYIMTKETGYKKFRRAFLKHFWSFLYHIAFRVKVTGKENIKLGEGQIICANHLNYLDAAGIVLTNKETIRFVAKNDLYKNPILASWGHVFNIIPIKRDSSDMASIKLCLKGLKNKDKIGIFPEGTRHGLDKHVELKNGACFLAYKAKVKIVPVGIKGSFKPFSKVTFNYGKPIDVASFKLDNPDWINDATKYVMKQIVELSK